MLVSRFDRGKLSRTSKTSAGFLRAPAFFTRAGVFQYLRADGKVVKELRPASEVFKEDSLSTLSCTPLTKDHPSDGMVDPKNAKDLVIGLTGESVTRKDDLIEGMVTITDAGAISDIEGGKLKEISMGYVCKIDATAGVDPVYGEYDQIQRDIRYNHAALGPESWGRAGSEVGLRLDSNAAVSRQDASSLELYIMQQADLKGWDRYELAKQAGLEPWDLEGVFFSSVVKRNFLEAIAKALEIDVKNLLNLTQRADALSEVKMETIVIGGVEFEVPKAAAQAMRNEQARQDSLVKEKIAENEKAQGRLDALSVELKTIQEKLIEAEKPERFDSAVNARLDLIAKAKKVLGDVEVKGTKREIMEMVVKKDAKDLDLSGKSDDYVEARFDALCEVQPTQSDLGTVRADTLKASIKDRVDAKEAQARMKERNAKAWQEPLLTTQKN